MLNNVLNLCLSCL